MRLGTVASSIVAVARNRRLVRLQGAYLSFGVYEMAVWVAVLLWAYAAGGAGFAGVVAIAQYVPAALLAPVGGIVADRLARDTALRLVYLAQAASLGPLAVLLATGPRLPAVVAASVSGVLIAWTRPAHYAAAAELSETPSQVAAANSLSGTSERAGYFVGPVLAGVGVAVLGPASTVLISAAMALAACTLLAGIRLRRPSQDTSETAGFEAEVRLAGELAHRPSVALMLGVLGVGFLVEGSLELLAIAFVSQHLSDGSAVAGLLIGSAGLGGIVGAASAMTLVRWRRLAPAVAGSLLVAGLPLLGFLVIDTVPAAVAVLVLTGAGLAFFSVAGLTLLQRSIPDGLIGRILAARETALLAGMAAGTALAPVLVRWVGSADGYVVLGAMMTALSGAAFPLLMRLDRTALYRPGLVPLLRRVEFLSVLDVRTLERLAHGAVEQRFDADAYVVRQGELGSYFYVIEVGDLEVSVHGRTETVRLGPGSGFGEIALLRNVPRTASVRALTACRLWTIDRELFLATIAGTQSIDVADRAIATQMRRLSSGQG
jgi:MFS family permease